MRHLRKLLILSIAIFTASIVTANAQNTASARQMSGRTLEQQIYRKVLNATNYGVFDFITAQVDGGTVTLSGKVNSIGTKSDAARSIKDLPGVTNVINNIEQLPASPFDDQIRREALRVFSNRGPSQYFAGPRPEVRIIVENGRLTLEGYVNSTGESNMLNVLANGINGVFSVQNNLIIGRDYKRQ